MRWFCTILAILLLLTLILGGISCGTNPPAISDVSAFDISYSSTTITWTTDKPSTSQVEYGEVIYREAGDPGYVSFYSTPLDENLVTSHSVTLSGLESNTTYRYRVKSKDSSGNEAVSVDKSFTNSLRTLWKFSTGLCIYYSSAAISTDESTVYFGTSYYWYHPPGSGHALYALDISNGTIKWKYDLGSLEVRSTPAVASDGSIYFMAEQRATGPNDRPNNKLCKLTPNGTFEWSYTIGSSLGAVGLSAPAIAADGTVYVVGVGLYAINPNGTLRWKGSGSGWDSPAIGSDGTVYLGGSGGYLYAVNPKDGRQKWSVRLPGAWNLLSSPAIASDGTIYIGGDEGTFYAVSPSGIVKWSYNVGNAAIRSSAAIAADGTIYFGTNPAKFFALKPDGTLKWTFEPDINWPECDIYSSPTIGSDGTIYFGAETSVYALNPDGTLSWKYNTIYGGITWPSPAIKSDGTIFIGNLAGDFYAIKSDSLGLSADSSWPRFHHDNQNKGGVSP